MGVGKRLVNRVEGVVLDLAISALVLIVERRLNKAIRRQQGPGLH